MDKQNADKSKVAGRIRTVTIRSLLLGAFLLTAITPYLANAAEKSSLFGNVAGQLEAVKNARARLEKALEGLPLNLLTAKVFQQKPKTEQVGEEGVSASWTVVVSYNYTNYTKRVLPALREALAGVATRKSSTDIQAGVLEYGGPPSYGILRLANSKVYGPGYFKWPSELSWDQKTEFLLLLHAGRSGGTTRLAWYVLDQRYIEIFDKVAVCKPNLRIELFDAQQQIVSEKDVDLTQCSYVCDFPAAYSDAGGGRVRPKQTVELNSETFPSFLTKRPAKKGAQEFFVLEPLIRIGATDKFSGYTGDTVAFVWKTTISLDQAKEVSQIQCRFTEPVIAVAQAQQEISVAASQLSPEKESHKPTSPSRGSETAAKAAKSDTAQSAQTQAARQPAASGLIASPSAELKQAMYGIPLGASLEDVLKWCEAKGVKIEKPSQANLFLHLPRKSPLPGSAVSRNTSI